MGSPMKDGLQNEEIIKPRGFKLKRTRRSASKN